MSVEVIAVGGYEEVGKNMSAIKVGEDVVIFDMGIHLDRIHIHEDTDIARMHSLDLIERGIIPDDTLMKDVDGKVRAIVFTHGHLDHIGAVAKLAHRYEAPLIATPYTMALIEKTIKGERKFKVTNPLQVLNSGEKMPDISRYNTGICTHNTQYTADSYTCTTHIRGYNYLLKRFQI